MYINFSLNHTVDPIAAYAAVLSTATVIWEIIKWQFRNNVDILCSANMLFVPSRNHRKYVAVIATNKGSTPTTITHFIMYYWDNKFNKIFNIKRKSFFINSDKVPKTISSGEQWQAQTEQTVEIEKMAKEGYLSIGIIHSMGKKEVLKRIKINSPKTNLLTNPTKNLS